MAKKSIRVDFFQAKGTDVAKLHELLTKLHSKPLDPIGGEAPILLTKLLSASPGIIEGDFTRIQMDDLPSRTKLSGKSVPLELDDDEGLGRDVAFLVHKTTHIVALQRNKTGATMSAIESLLQRMLDGPTIEFLPIFNEEVFKRAMRLGKATRRLQLKIAAPSSGAALKGDCDATKAAIKFMKTMASPTIDVSVSMGHQDGFLAAVKEIVEDVWRSSKDFPDEDVFKLSLKGTDESTGQPDEIDDLFADRLSESVSVTVKGRVVEDKDRRYAVHQAWMKHKDMLLKQYG